MVLFVDSKHLRRIYLLLRQNLQMCIATVYSSLAYLWYVVFHMQSTLEFLESDLNLVSLHMYKIIWR